MAKRFTETEKWTKNKWFRMLSKDLKLFWLFILDNCDSVGVWEEDIDFFNYIMSTSIDRDTALSMFSKQIYVMPGGRKFWIKDFCFFQYGILKEENTKNKPHIKYISELKKHRLWIDYTKSLYSLEEKEEEKDKEEDKEKPKLKKPTVDEVIEYFSKNGYTEQSARKAFNYYEENNWKDSKGNKVLNWKQKMIANWFKDADKIPPSLFTTRPRLSDANGTK